VIAARFDRCHDGLSLILCPARACRQHDHAAHEDAASRGAHEVSFISLADQPQTPMFNADNCAVNAV
jgi:hypothetical protein